MIIFFGPTGSGKSMQGQLMAVRHGWRWINVGQLLRDTSDPAIYQYLKAGELVPGDYVNNLVFAALDEVRDDSEIQKVILDGYPRSIEQTNALLGYIKDQDEKIDIVIDLSVQEAEVLKRLRLRGRMEDDMETIAHRLSQHATTTQPVLDYLESQKIPVVTVDGSGSVGEVHDRIEKVLEDHKVTGKF